MESCMTMIASASPLSVALSLPVKITGRNSDYQILSELTDSGQAKSYSETEDYDIRGWSVCRMHEAVVGNVTHVDGAALLPRRPNVVRTGKRELLPLLPTPIGWRSSLSAI